MTVDITLTDAEVMQAAQVGCWRYWWHVKANTPDTVAGGENAWSQDIEGACAELAVARYLNTYWNAYTRHYRDLPGDVGNVQVRSSRHPEAHLILRPRDRSEAWYVLVVGTAPRLRICGALQGIDGMQDRFWRTGHPGAWWLPQQVLTPMTEWHDVPAPA